MFKYLAPLTIGSLLVTSFPVQAESVQGDALLCLQRGWHTSMAVSTKKFNAAACFSDTSGYYIGQSKINNEKIILPLLAFQYADSGNFFPFIYTGSGLTYQATNGPYTYQLFSKTITGCAPYGWATLSVFKNGSRIYHEKVNKFISEGADCHAPDH